jgi:hypothetical protein
MKQAGKPGVVMEETMAKTAQMSWLGDRLLFGGRMTSYAIVADAEYAGMWRVERADGWRSDLLNRARAKDAALLLLDRSLRVSETPARGAVAVSPALGETIGMAVGTMMVAGDDGTAWRT